MQAQVGFAGCSQVGLSRELVAAGGVGVVDELSIRRNSRPSSSAPLRSFRTGKTAEA